MGYPIDRDIYGVYTTGIEIEVNEMKKWTVTASENGEQFAEANFDRKANAARLMDTLKRKIGTGQSSLGGINNAQATKNPDHPHLRKEPQRADSSVVERVQLQEVDRRG